MPRAVLDTNVLVSGLISPNGTPARLISESRLDFFTECSIMYLRRASP